jgi:hypothetical protein
LADAIGIEQPPTGSTVVTDMPSLSTGLVSEGQMTASIPSVQPEPPTTQKSSMPLLIGAALAILFLVKK